MKSSHPPTAGTATTVIFAAFLGGCGITATLFFWHQRKLQASSSRRSTLIDESSGGLLGSPLEPVAQRQRKLPNEIREEQLSRHTLFFGQCGIKKLKEASVCVVGVGGVGSHTAHMLARSGIGLLRLIDFDQVTVSSLNRHATATLNDVGIAKVECLARYLRLICPDERFLKVEPIGEMYTDATGERLLKLSDNGTDKQWDMVIDCIDDVPTKAALLRYCLCNKIRVLSCMGAAGKSDPTRLHISDMRSAARDPLASKIRQALKQTMKDSICGDDTTYLDDMDQLTILFSSETTVVKLAEFTEEQKQEGVREFGAVDGMRIRLLPVLGTMPAIMGQALAGICITVLAGQKLQPVTGERVGRNTRNKIYQKLVQREQDFAKRVRIQVQEAGDRSITQQTKSVNGDGELITIRAANGDLKTKLQPTIIWIGHVQIDQADDMEYMMEIWRNRCAITGARLGVVLHLVRWNRSRPSTCNNLVLISANVLDEFERDPETFKASIDSATRQCIEKRLDSCRVDG